MPRSTEPIRSEPVKLVGLGMSGCGKTAFFSRMLRNGFSERYEKTNGFKIWGSVEQQDGALQLQICELGGNDHGIQEISSHLNGAQILLFFVSPTNPKTLAWARKYDVWVQMFAPNALKYLVCSKSDLRGIQGRVADEELEAFKGEIHAKELFVYSSKNDCTSDGRNMGDITGQIVRDYAALKASRSVKTEFECEKVELENDQKPSSRRKKKRTKAAKKRKEQQAHKRLDKAVLNAEKALANLESYAKDLSDDLFVEMAPAIERANAKSVYEYYNKILVDVSDLKAGNFSGDAQKIIGSINAPPERIADALSSLKRDAGHKHLVKNLLSCFATLLLALTLVGLIPATALAVNNTVQRRNPFRFFNTSYDRANQSSRAIDDVGKKLQLLTR